jgi:hypothetical protein
VVRTMDPRFRGDDGSSLSHFWIASHRFRGGRNDEVGGCI